MHIAIASALIAVGVLAGGVGALAGADPEGRGGNLLLLLPVGAAVALAGVVYLAYRAFGALFGG